MTPGDNIKHPILGRGRKGVLRKKLRAAGTYQVSSLSELFLWTDVFLKFGRQEWKAVAEVLDEHLHFHEWKMVDEDPYYDWKLVRKVM